MTRVSALPGDRQGARRGGAQGGISMVEFALVAPMFFVLILGMFVGGLVMMNQNQVTNASRDAVRAAAVCGGPSRNTLPVVPTLPDGRTPCDSTRLINWINRSLQAVPGGVVTGICVFVGSSGGDALGDTCVAADPLDPNILDKCNKGTVVQVSIDYPQQLFVPFVGRIFGDNGGQIRTLHARSEAVCEQ